MDSYSMNDGPGYGSSGGDQSNPYPQGSREWYAYQNFGTYGYTPSKAEVGSMTPYWSDAGMGGSAGAIAQFMLQKQQQQEAEKNSPQAVYARQQSQWQQAAPQHYNAVGQMIQSTLGRNATQDELSHYGSLMASGQADPYTIQQFIKSTPEYQNTQDTQFRSGLNTELQGYDQQFFDRAKNDVVGKYAQMGRQTSPALDVALTDLAAQINERRGQYLAQVGTQQYGGNKAAAISDYQAQQQQAFGRSNSSLGIPYQQFQAGNSRMNSLSDYNTQAMNYQNMLDKYGPKTGALDYLNAGLNVINTGANVVSAFGPGGAKPSNLPTQSGGSMPQQQNYYG